MEMLPFDGAQCILLYLPVVLLLFRCNLSMEFCPSTFLPKAFVQEAQLNEVERRKCCS